MKQLPAENAAVSAAVSAAASAEASHVEPSQFSMLGGVRIMSSAADAERSARLISWLCALVAGRDRKPV